MEGFPLNFSNFGEIGTFRKSIHQILSIPYPPNPFPPILLSKQGILIPSKSLPFLSPISYHPNTHYVWIVTLKRKEKEGKGREEIERKKREMEGK